MIGCFKCNKQFTYKQILRSLMVFKYRPIPCLSCNQQYEVSLGSRLIFALLAIALPYVARQWLLNMESVFYIIVQLMWGIGILLLLPYFIKIKPQVK